MELVYLWVEGYKNIHKQGFNFSPRFECKFYDEYETYIDDNGEEKERLKDNCTLDIKPKEHIENFFGDNINVTAIVGKNGSGKSSVLELLKVISRYQKLSEFNFIMVLQVDKIIYLSNFIIKTDIIKNNDGNKGYETYPYRVDVSPHFNTIFTGDISEIVLEQNEIIKIIIMSKFKNEFQLSSFMFIPTQLIIKYKNKINIIFKDIFTKSSTKYKEKAKELLNSNFSEYHKFLIITYINNCFLKRDTHRSPNINNIHIENLKDNEVELLKNEELLKDSLSNEPISTKEEFNNFFKKGTIIKIIIDMDKKEKEIYSKYYQYFDFFTLIDNKKRSYNQLSHGEKTLFGQLLNIYNFLNKNDMSSLFLFDEPELSLHPNWQKRYLEEINNLFLKFKHKIHFILTSHSPFLLSDIPKQNIIFLDTDDEGKCKVVDGLKEKKETFGANIHTLLSDSFFMEDGLMGEFAKGKIDKAIKLLNQEHLDEKDLKYCEQIISIIGEPIVKNQLQRILDSKRLRKIDEIDSIKSSMLEMQKRLDELER